jgi:molybdopterin biosynthesis enzyme
VAAIAGIAVSRLGFKTEIETGRRAASLAGMAESFGNAFTIVEVTSDDASTRQMWLALAKPSQALTLVLAAVPEGWKAEIVPAVLTEKQQRLFEEVSLKPGDVYRLTSE